MSGDHYVAVTFTGGRYPHTPTCSCGWEHAWGFVAAHAAQIVAEAHAAHMRTTEGAA